MEDQESLQASALVSELSNAVQDNVNDLLSDGVMTTSVVVGSIFFTSDQLFWMEELTISSGTNFIDDSWLEINKHCTWHMLATSGFTEESVEGIISTTNSFIRWHLTIWLNSMFEAVKLPTGVTNLNTSLPNMN